MARGECCAECQRKKHAERGAALRRGIEHAAEEHPLAVPSAQATVSPARMSWVKSSASGAIVIGVFTRLLALLSRWGLVELSRPTRSPRPCCREVTISGEKDTTPQSDFRYPAKGRLSGFHVRAADGRIGARTSFSVG